MAKGGYFAFQIEGFLPANGGMGMGWTYLTGICLYVAAAVGISWILAVIQKRRRRKERRERRDKEQEHRET